MLFTSFTNIYHNGLNICNVPFKPQLFDVKKIYYLKNCLNYFPNVLFN